MLVADPVKDADFIRKCSEKLGFGLVPERMKKAFESISDNFGPLDIRSAFMGGNFSK